MSLVGSVGGAYGALLNKKKEKKSGDAPKPKVAKVMSLKDTKEKNPVNKKEAKEKKPEPTKKKVEEEEKKDLTKREVKSEQKSHDRRPRSGHAPESKGQKSDIVSDALEAAAEKGETEKDERAKEAEERAAREAEEAKKMTFADFEKAREEKRKALNMKTSERKVDNKQFSKMQAVVASKDNNDDFMQFSKKTETKAVGGAQKGKKEKKGKFAKSENVQLGFFSKPAQAPRNNRPRREDKKPEEKKAEEPKTE